MATKTKNPYGLNPPKLLTEDLTQGRASWDYEAVYDAKGQKLKIVIKRDAYDFQSWAYVDAFDKAAVKWNRIVDLAFSEALQTHKVSYVDRNPSYAAFRADAQVLLNRAVQILDL